MNQLHFLTGDIDQLVVLRMQRSNRQEPVLGELRQHHQPLAIGIPGFGQRRVVVARLIMHIQLLADVVHVLAVVVPDGIGNVPLAHLAVDKQSGVGVTPTVVCGVQGPKTQLWLTHHGITGLNRSVEQVIQLLDRNNGDRWRQLAIGNKVLAVRGGIQAMRVLGNRDVAGQVRACTTVHHRHLGVAQGLVVTVPDCLLDALDVEHDGPIPIVAHGAGQIQCLLRVVAGGTGVFAGVVGIGVVQVAIHNHLEGHFHGFRVHRVEHGEAAFKAGVAAIVRMGDDILGVTEHVLGLGNLLKTQAVNGLNIRNGGDLVALHDVQADPGYTSVGLVVNEQVFAVITTIRHGNVGVMGIAVQVGIVMAQHVLAFIADPPTGGRIHIEHGDAHQFPHGRYTQNPYFTGVTTTPEPVVFVELAGMHHELVTGLLGGSRKGLPRHHGSTQAGCTGDSRKRSSPHKPTAALAAFRKLRQVFGQIISFFHNIQLRYW